MTDDRKTSSRKRKTRKRKTINDYRLMILTAQFIGIAARETYPAELEWNNNLITAVRRLPEGTPVGEGFLCPGFVDAHVHIESSMLVPAENKNGSTPIAISGTRAMKLHNVVMALRFLKRCTSQMENT